LSWKYKLEKENNDGESECYGPWMFNVQRKNISGRKVSKTNGSDGKRRLVKMPEYEGHNKQVTYNKGHNKQVIIVEKKMKKSEQSKLLDQKVTLKASLVDEDARAKSNIKK